MGPHILHAAKEHTIKFYEKYGVRKIDYYAKMSEDNTIRSLIDFPYSVDTVFQLPREVGKKVLLEFYELSKDEIEKNNLEEYL